MSGMTAFNIQVTMTSEEKQTQKLNSYRNIPDCKYNQNALKK